MYILLGFWLFPDQLCLRLFPTSHFTLFLIFLFSNRFYYSAAYFKYPWILLFPTRKILICLERNGSLFKLYNSLFLPFNLTAKNCICTSKGYVLKRYMNNFWREETLSFFFVLIKTSLSSLLRNTLEKFFLYLEPITFPSRQVKRDCYRVWKFLDSSIWSWNTSIWSWNTSIWSWNTIVCIKSVNW